MPELPELEILRRDLDKEVGGRKIKATDVSVPASVKRNTNKKIFGSKLHGAKISGASRRGSLLVLQLDTEQVLAISISPTGQLRRQQNKEAKDKATLATVTFTQHGQLRLIDASKKSWMWVADSDELDEFVGSLGFDLAREPVSWTAFGEALRRRDGKLKNVLMDETFLVGIGPMYSDEILFEAGLRADRSPDSLTTQEIRRLFRAAVEKVHDALKYNGTSIGDDGFVNLAGEPGNFQGEINVYKRDGQLSPRARGNIVKQRFGSGYTYFCEQTQM